MAYPSDLKDKQWAAIKDNFHNGNRAKHDKRVLLNAVLYVVKTGCQWRWLPKDFPCWKTVYTFFRRMCIEGVWEKILQQLVLKTRVQAGKDPGPTYCIIDSQSVKTTGPADSRGIDGGKKNQGTEEAHSY
jgi:transposase